MRIARLTVTHFRNYERLVWTPSDRLIVVDGDNGAGKTNLLEAVSLLAPGRGLRSAALPQLPQHGHGVWGVAADIMTRAGECSIGTGNDPQGTTRRVFALNGAPVRAQSDIADVFSCVWLTPQMDRLFLEAASGRRRFLDRLVVALDTGHARETAAHDRSVAQRNRLLADRPHEDAWLSAVEDSIARHAVAVTASRMMLVDAMNRRDGVPDSFPQVDLALECDIAERLARQSALSVEDAIRGELRASRTEDRRLGATAWGAHRSDLLMSDRRTHRPASTSSTGQQKAMLLGVILAHAQLIGEQRGDVPVLLLDEPLVHLDQRRREALAETLLSMTGPALLTGTDADAFSSLQGRAEFLHVSEGRISRKTE